MLTKNDELTVYIESVGINGEGIARVDEKTVFIPYALTGEKVVVKIVKVCKDYAYGKLLEVLTPSKFRRRAVCPIYGKCGGCQIQHLVYSSQLKLKENIVRNAFKKIAGLDVHVSPCVKSTAEFGYRNKLQLPVQDSMQGTAIGFYAENSHRVVKTDDCPINNHWTADVIKSFGIYIKEFSIKGYDERLNTGELREITVKTINGNLIIVAVVLDKNLRGADKLVSILKENVKTEFSLYFNVNDKRTNVIYGNEFILKYGKGFYFGETFGVKYKIGVQSFMQVNDDVCKKLYGKVRDFACVDEETTVIDAYSGAGIMTALVSKNAKKGIGIEIVPEAVRCADELVKLNGLDGKISNYCGKCEDLLPEIIEKEMKDGSKTVLILDPPRKGCDYAVIKSAVDSKVEKIIYVSCMPSTLARDVGLITGALVYKDGLLVKNAERAGEYEISEIRPFDMFPQTRHVETLCVLTRVDDKKS